jgi:putative transposase
MPNHFHFLLKQVAGDGVAKYLSLFTNSYTRYFNTKHNRIGPLFQGVFKAVRVESNNQLLHLSRYIHLNPYVSNIVTKTNLSTYPWSSLPSYLFGIKDFVESKIVTSQYKDIARYRDFVLNHADYARELEYIKHMTLDLER